MKLKFTKMHGLGNDFMVIDGTSQSIELTPQQIQQLSHRHTGVGFDQLLLLQKTDNADYDFIYRIFNADGNEVEQCGNGARCFAHFIHAKGLSDKKTLRVKTLKGVISLTQHDDDQISVNMGKPRWQCDEIPMQDQDSAPPYKLTLDSKTIHFFPINVGNPHVVITVPSVADAPVEELGRLLVNHETFFNGANIGFMEICNHSHIKLRVFERGVGETLACGSGACAAVVAGILQHLLDDSVTVSLPGGDLHIQWDGGDNDIIMTGPACVVYEGVVDLN